MYMDIFKNLLIRGKQYSIEIENLISIFSKKVAEGEMKYFPAVGSLEKYILKNLDLFSNDEKRWKTRRKYELKFRKENNGKNPTTYPSSKKKSPASTRYILDAIDYYNEARLKFDKSERSKWDSQKSKFEKTRQFTSH